jgi:AcrR family transcriptional regulator
MPRRTPSPPAPPRERILRAAKELFAERGFAGTGVDAIAKRAGVNKALLYYHVGNKGELYNEVLAGMFASVGARVAAAVDEPGSSRRRLRRVQEALAVVFLEVPEYAPIVLREIAGGGRNLAPETLRAMGGVFASTRRMFEEGSRTGEFRDLDPVPSHLFVVGSLIFLLAARPLRERIAAADRSLRLVMPAPDFDVVAFLHDVVSDGIAARRRRGARS